MARFKLLPYRIRVREKYDDDFLDLSELPDGKGNTKPFSRILEGFLTSYLDDVYEYQENEKTFFTENPSTIVDEDTIHGLLWAGNWGIEASFYNRNREEVIENARTEEDAEMLPYFMLYDYPSQQNPDMAFLMLQKFKNKGAKTVFAKALSEYISDEFNDDLTVEVNPIISKELAKKIENAEKVVEMSFIKREVTKDVAGKHIDNYEDVKEERIFRAQRDENIVVRKAEKVVESIKNNETRYLEIEDEKYEELKVTIKERGSETTVSLGKASRFREKKPISREDVKTDGGHPIQTSILEEAKEYMDTILRSHDERPLGGREDK